MDNNYFVYILCNEAKTVLYVGVTNDLRRRLTEHKQGMVEGFTKKYNVDILVYAESHSDIKTAIAREKQIKRWSRKKKENLINTINPEWEELRSY